MADFDVTFGAARFGRKQQETKMATDDRSPSMFCGQSWASWADGMSITDGNDDEEDDNTDSKDEGDSMKLNKKDKDLYGFCPQTEELLLVQCEVCGIWVKPQALKQHTVDRHGSVDSVSVTSDEQAAAQAATDKVLNSELAKTLASVSGFGKGSSVSKPPTKASLKQVPSSVRMVGNAPVNSTSRSLKKSNTNPVVKVERIPKEVATLKKVTTAPVPSENSALRDVMTTSPAQFTVTSASVPDSAVIKSSVVTPPTDIEEKALTNGAMLKKALSSRPPLPVYSAAPVTSMPVPPVLTTTTTSVTYTRPALTNNTFAVAASTTYALLTGKGGKPLQRTASLSSALAATLTAAHPLRPTPHSTSTLGTGGSGKSKKSPKERKFLPCKDREFDPNKHCGVVMEETGKPCTRSLTCKTHALGLRRAVPGRKKTFDDLLKEHKANKEALLKAKAEEQAAAAGGLSLAAHSVAQPAVINSPAALAAVSAIKLGPEMLMHREIKPAVAGLLSQASFQRTLKPASAKPLVSAVFQKVYPGGSFPPSLTVKEEPSPIPDPTRPPQPIEKEGGEPSIQQEKADVTYLSHHPRPAAVCTFGARIAGGGCALFSRKYDLIRAAVLSITEKPSGQPPHKKLCVESRLPKEQTASSSKDPYEFSTVDSGLAHQRQTVSFTIGAPNTTLKPLLKHKPKTLASLGGVSVANLAVSTATPTTVIPTTALLKPSKGPESVLPRATLAMPQTISSQSLKRKRSSQGSSGSGQSVTPSTIQLQGTSIGLTVSPIGLAGHTAQQQGAIRAVTATSNANSHSATTPLTAITIPGVNFGNAALGLSAALPSNKQQGGQGQKTGSINYKDISLVLTGLDSGGQYLNISGAQLAELAAAQAVTATAEDKNIKRSRLANAKHSTTHTLRTLQHGCLTTIPPNAVLVDGSALQGAVLTPVSSLSGAGSGSGGNSTFVAFTSGTITSSQSGTITVAPNTIFRTVSVSDSGTPQHVTLTSASFPNGIITSSGDKVHVATTGSSSGLQTQRLVSSSQGRVGMSTAKTLQTAQLLQAQGTPICPNPGLTQLAHFKPGTFNIKGGKITMQPVSLTIPISSVGLGALNQSQQQNPHSHTQPTLLVTTSSADDGRAGGASVSASGGRTEIHLQPQLSTASTGMIS